MWKIIKAKAEKTGVAKTERKREKREKRKEETKKERKEKVRIIEEETIYGKIYRRHQKSVVTLSNTCTYESE